MYLLRADEVAEFSSLVLHKGDYQLHENGLPSRPLPHVLTFTRPRTIDASSIISRIFISQQPKTSLINSSETEFSRIHIRTFDLLSYFVLNYFV